MITETITTLAAALERRETTAEALLDRCLERIAERNAAINAFITVCEAGARAQARDADREIAAGRYRGPLHGIPISLKDLFDLRVPRLQVLLQLRAPDADVVRPLESFHPLVQRTQWRLGLSLERGHGGGY